MISWLGTVIGLRVHNQIRAIVSCISVTVAWCLLPFAILIPMIISFEIQSGSAPGVLLLLSPVTAVVFNEVADLDDVGLGSEELAFLLNSILYITALVLIRNYCLTSLEQHLKRRDQESGPE